MELSIEGLSKRFGSKVAVDNISVTLQPGVYGLLGANGAGKTTLMRMVCDILKPTSGKIFYDGKEIEELGETYRRCSREKNPYLFRWHETAPWNCTGSYQ